MTGTEHVHLCPPVGSGLTPCCDRPVSALAPRDRITTYGHEVTCTERALAVLVVEQDDGESPFGWREDTDPGPAPASGRGRALTAALRAVRRQCQQWARPTGAVTWDARNRDLGVAAAAGVLIDIIDRLAPGLGDGDPDEAAQQPRLEDRLAAVLATTARADCPGWALRGFHGEGGHAFDARCAMCTGDIDALAAALTDAVTHTPLPHLGSHRPEGTER